MRPSALVPNATLDGVSIDSADLDGLSVSGMRTLETALRGCKGDRVEFPHWTGSAVEISDSAFGTFRANDASLMAVEIIGSRFGALMLDSADLTDVLMSHCRIDVISLRRAKARRLQFVDCRIGMIDLGEADVANVTFTGGRVDEFSGSRQSMTAVDLSATDLTRIADLSALRGVAVSEAQAVAHAAAFAAHLGASVVADTESASE